MESITGLWAEFAQLIFTFNFLWVVVATTITMEVLKWTVLSSHMNKRWYPLVVLGVVAFWVLLKTIFTGDWREIVGNLVFTVMMADVVYTYCGQYIMKGLIWVFKAITGNRGNIDNEPKS
jgi:hypothetical protein